MDINDLKNRLKKYVAKRGRNGALADLIEQGVGPSTAWRLVDGVYPQNRPTRRIEEAIVRVLKEAKVG
jgi:hypothetical protein